ncbi:MAG: sigma-54-dependent Fis family transcriptional regulator [Burkholderiales bacterium]
MGAGLIDPLLQASWQRSQDHGLLPQGRVLGAPHASGAQLARALAHRHALVAHARPVMEFLSEQIRDTDSLVILADTQGMLLHTLGDTSFADRAARVALRPGAIWTEQWRGTNAIGTALADDAAVVVHGAEHYLERNGFLTCTAAPITDPAGQVLGVLDISGDHRAFQHGQHRHALGLVRAAARMIEHQLFEARHTGGLQLRLHSQPEGIGTVTEGLVALSDDGWIIGANVAALTLLGLARNAIGATRIEAVLALDLPALLGPSAAARLPRRVHRHDGHPLWLRADLGRHVAASSLTSTTARAVIPADALAALDTGDGAMQAVIGRARRVQGKPIALLLQGESGVGKELFARACHDSSARDSGPFVAVNCAALPETLIEAELFGYRPGAFTGAGRDGAPGRIREAHRGTLFLDEIGDMPLALQAKLLRVLQERQVTPLGGGKAEAVDFQLICASHRRLREEVDAGRFRDDLYYRINGLTLQLPPLRERSDLAALTQAMLKSIEPSRPHRLAPEVAAAFARYRWPGNLRQLNNVLRTACALMDNDEHEIGWPHLPDDVAEELIGPPCAAAATARPIDDPEIDNHSDLRLQAERTIDQTVRGSQGNLSEAARRLGISRNTLYRKLRGARQD